MRRRSIALLGAVSSMTKISGSTFYFKTLFPVVWFGLLTLFLLRAGLTDERSLEFVIGSIVMAIFGFAFFKTTVWDLADEILDAGDHLIFRKGEKKQRVRFEEIINIDYKHMAAPERVTIHFLSPGATGRRLVFNPPLRLNPFSESPIVADLIARVDNARGAQ